MDLPVGAEACDLTASRSRLVETLHSCYGRFMWMDDSEEPSRARAGSLIPGAEAAEIVKQNKWMNNPSNEQRAQAGHRDHLSTALTRRSRRRSAEHTPCWSEETEKGSLRYESQSKSKSLLTLENKRRVPTEVMWLLFQELFLPEIMSLALSSLHLSFSSLFSPTEKQRLLWS